MSFISSSGLVGIVPPVGIVFLMCGMLYYMLFDHWILRHRMFETPCGIEFIRVCLTYGRAMIVALSYLSGTFINPRVKELASIEHLRQALL